MSTWLYSYSPKSEGAKQLAEALSIRRIKHTGSAFRGNRTKRIINWGSSDIHAEVGNSPILNSPEKIVLASNKRSFFQRVSEINEEVRPRIPYWTTDPQVALSWIQAKKTVCVRRVLQGHSGEGLILVGPNNIADFVEAPLYTVYVPKKDEYRVHIVNGEVIDYQRKALRSDIDRDEADWRVRNLMNGFVFVRENGEIPEDVLTQAKLAMSAVELDFGAVDVLYQNNRQKAYVIEINTAPGLMNTTLEKYAEAFRKVI